MVEILVDEETRERDKINHKTNMAIKQSKKQWIDNLYHKLPNEFRIDYNDYNANNAYNGDSHAGLYAEE